jgi:hypothetical protein
MYKKTLFAAAVLALSTAAFAQSTGAVPAPTAAAPVSALAPQAVNPFSGKSLSLESRQRALEIAKMETSLLEEQLKQASLAEDMAVMPLKKQVETAQATTARMKEELLQKEVTNAPKIAAIQAAAAQKALNPMPVPSAAKARPVKKVKPVEPVVETVKPVAPPVHVPRIELTTIMNFGGTRAAVLDVDGNILTVKSGDNTPIGIVEIVDDQSVRVNGKPYKVHGATLARVVISDPKPVDPKAPVPPPVAAPVVPAQAGPAMATFPGPVGQMPMGRNGQPSLPPLQLPAGVTLLPATAN